MEKERQLLEKVTDLFETVGALAGQVSELNYRVGELEKKQRR